MPGVRQIRAIEPASPPRVHVNLLSVDPDRRSELFRRLDGDVRFTLAERADRSDAEMGVLALDIAGAEAHAIELVRRLSGRPAGRTILVVMEDEDDIELACALLLAGASGVTSLRQPASGLCEAVADVAAGLASVSPAIEADLVRRLRALPAA